MSRILCFLKLCAILTSLIGTFAKAIPPDGGGTGAPGVPSNLSVPSTSTSGSYTITWSLRSGTAGLTEVFIYESTDGQNYTIVGLVDHPTTSYSIKGRASGNYFYNLNACNSRCGGSTNSVFIKVRKNPIDPQPPRISIQYPEPLPSLGTNRPER